MAEQQYGVKRFFHEAVGELTLNWQTPPAGLLDGGPGPGYFVSCRTSTPRVLSAT
ncbi:hypothetical protein [Amycolatopsis sp. NPDC003731]